MSGSGSLFDAPMPRPRILARAAEDRPTDPMPALLGLAPDSDTDVGKCVDIPEMGWDWDCVCLRAWFGAGDKTNERRAYVGRSADADADTDGYGARALPTDRMAVGDTGDAPGPELVLVVDIDSALGLLAPLALPRVVLRLSATGPSRSDSLSSLSLSVSVPSVSWSCSPSVSGGADASEGDARSKLKNTSCNGSC